MDYCASAHKHFTESDVKALYGSDVSSEDMESLRHMKNILNTFMTLKCQLEYRVHISIIEGLYGDRLRQENIPNYLQLYRDCKRTQLTDSEVSILTSMREQHVHLVDYNKQLSTPFRISVAFLDLKLLPPNHTIHGRRYHDTKW